MVFRFLTVSNQSCCDFCFAQSGVRTWGLSTQSENFVNKHFSLPQISRINSIAPRIWQITSFCRNVTSSRRGTCSTLAVAPMRSATVAAACPLLLSSWSLQCDSSQSQQTASAAVYFSRCSHFPIGAHFCHECHLFLKQLSPPTWTA